MFPNLEIFSTVIPFCVVATAVFVTIVIFYLRCWARELSPMPVREILYFILLPLPFTWLGAKVFHLAFETKLPFGQEWLGHLLEPAGRVFYGSLLGFIAAFTVFLRGKTSVERKTYWRAATELGALGYFILRIDCFAEGCCWGSMTSLPIAVIYERSDATMPYLGVPVHPVQLYDAFLGLVIFGLLRCWNWRSPLASFLLFYSFGRIVTELFRGDSIRGTHVVAGLSLAQSLSVAIFLIVCGWLVAQTLKQPGVVRT